jgi:hypothetical protein
MLKKKPSLQRSKYKDLFPSPPDLGRRDLRFRGHILGGRLRRLGPDSFRDAALRRGLRGPPTARLWPPGFHPKYLGRLVQRVLAIDRPPAKEKYMSKKVLILTDGGRDFA